MVGHTQDPRCKEHPGFQMGGAPRIPDGRSTQNPRWEEHSGFQIRGASRIPDGGNTQDPKWEEHTGFQILLANFADRYVQQY